MRSPQAIVLLAAGAFCWFGCEAPPEAGTDDTPMEATALKKGGKPKGPADAGAAPTTPPPGLTCASFKLPLPACFLGDPKPAAADFCAKLALELNQVVVTSRCGKGSGAATALVECCAPVVAPPPTPPAKCEAGELLGCASHDELWEQIRGACAERQLEVASIAFGPACGPDAGGATYVCCPPPPAPPPPPPAKCTSEQIADLNQCRTVAQVRPDAEKRCEALGRRLEGDVVPGDSCGKGGMTWGTARCCLP
jgi:hypothetical protein